MMDGSRRLVRMPFVMLVVRECVENRCTGHDHVREEHETDRKSVADSSSPEGHCRRERITQMYVGAKRSASGQVPF